ncbi:MAG: transcription-repair coupling factor [Sodalis sp. (in: enterobacteria)]
MSKHVHFTLPTQPGKKLILGQLTGAAYAFECAAMVDRYPKPVLVIATDMQNALQLYDEIRQFTRHPVLTLQDFGTLPYDHFSPHQEIISDRIATLYRLPTLVQGVIILSVNTLMQRVCPHDFLHRHTLLLTKDQRLSREKLCSHLAKFGYRSVDQVMEHGEFAIRGTLLDLYPMGNKAPYRLDFFNNKINSMRIFNVDNQRTLQETDLITLLPAHEFPIDHAAIELFRHQWRAQFDMQCNSEHIYQQISKGILPAGIEYWQPLFFSNPLVSLFRYLPEGTLVINTGDLEVSATRFWINACARFKLLRVNPMRPLLPPEALWLRVDDLFAEIKRSVCVQLSMATLQKKTDQYNMHYRPLPDLAVETQRKTPMDKLRQFCEQFDGQVIFSIETEGRRETLRELLAQIKIFPKLINKMEEAIDRGSYLIIGASESGFIDESRERALICESDLLGKGISRRRQDTRRIINSNILIHHLSELHEGQPVVHVQHGVGRYAGMITLEANGIQAEYLILIYAGNDKLYVPVLSLHLIRRYASNSDEKAPLHKLGSNAWTKVRQKTVEQVRDVAAELLDIYARRAVKIGFAFRQNLENYQLFCEGFPFELSRAQAEAINAVLSDMSQPLAMDRLVCGDVGFGKTEVAMRAAFLAIENQKQVAVLVPTTLLAQQHFENFCNRFANWPVRIEMISRFRNARDQALVLEKTAEGKVDILIGTHKLLQCDVKWHDLGLLILDEEHRFGVRQKERIKEIRTNIDILTLTATPIPRTLNMAISGIRDLSIIATPPARRRSVKTFVQEYDAGVVREAILREVLRGGQVYYLYNNVATIERTACQLSTLVPEAQIGIGHGQLRERDLERVIHDFHHQRFNVLVCTTIIETGIDIANANTIIIERADHFGLAQLHQLRGRVGRSHHQAYAYFLIPPLKCLSQDAQKRLEAITSLEDLGAGFALATHDLEIRGAGKLLGEDQSGQIESVGFSLYMELLENAIEALKSGREPSQKDLFTKEATEVELHMPTLLPEKYIPNVNIRMLLYQRINSAADDHELEELKVELIDRFGILPDPVRYLLAITSLKHRANSLGIQRIDGGDKGGVIEFRETNHVDPAVLIDLLTREPSIYRLDGPSRLKFICNLKDCTARLHYVNWLLWNLKPNTLKNT